MTRQRQRQALAPLVALATGAAIGGLPGRVQAVVLAFAGLCIVGAVLGDGVLGFVVGGLMAAAYLEVARRSGMWAPGALPRTAVIGALLLLLGWTLGSSVAAVRGARRPEAPGLPATPRGHCKADPLHRRLLTLTEGRLRLDDEVHRARSAGTPLGLLVVRTTIADAALDFPARASAKRSVARVVASRTRRTDIPFSHSSSQVCAVLPVTERAAAWGVLAAFLKGLDEAVFTDRTHAAVLPVQDFVEVEASLVFLAPGHSTGDQLIDDATSSLRDAPARPGRGPSMIGKGPTPPAGDG